MTAAGARPVIHWFRQDLRLADNPALAAAVATGRPVIGLYVLDEVTPGAWTMGAASLWWLGRSLDALGESLRARGGCLVLRQGAAEAAVIDLAQETGAEAVHWAAATEPFARESETRIASGLQRIGISARTFPPGLLFDPDGLRTGTGARFRVFGAFWRAVLARGDPAEPLPAPRRIPAPPAEPASDPEAAARLRVPADHWSRKFDSLWRPGEAGAEARLSAFLARGLAGYSTSRDLLAAEATSRLSPHLHFGEIGPARVWHAVRAAALRRNLEADAESFLRELGWRDFAHHVLLDRPELPDQPLRPQFARLGWRSDEASLGAWRTGETGYPVVDAAMRELWDTGFMHNRARMIAASFLAKHLLIPWQTGEAWFWDTLVDADLASNALNWQWVAGTGIDAAPFFRIFNPVLQGEKFDGDGEYVRRFIPELARLDRRHIHKPWTAPESVLRRAGVVLGRDYPAPVVDHGAARARALAAFAAIKGVA